MRCGPHKRPGHLRCAACHVTSTVAQDAGCAAAVAGDAAKAAAAALAECPDLMAYT